MSVEQIFRVFFSVGTENSQICKKPNSCPSGALLLKHRHDDRFGTSLASRPTGLARYRSRCDCHICPLHLPLRGPSRPRIFDSCRNLTPPLSKMRSVVSHCARTPSGRSDRTACGSLRSQRRCSRLRYGAPCAHCSHLLVRRNLSVSRLTPFPARRVRDFRSAQISLFAAHCIRRSRLAVSAPGGRSNRAARGSLRSRLRRSLSRRGAPRSPRSLFENPHSVRALANRPRALPHHLLQHQSRRHPALVRFRELPAPYSPSCRERPHVAGASRHSPATR